MVILLSSASLRRNNRSRWTVRGRNTSIRLSSYYACNDKRLRNDTIISAVIVSSVLVGQSKEKRPYARVRRDDFWCRRSVCPWTVRVYNDGARRARHAYTEETPGGRMSSTAGTANSSVPSEPGVVIIHRPGDSHTVCTGRTSLPFGVR